MYECTLRTLVCSWLAAETCHDQAYVLDQEAVAACVAGGACVTSQILATHASLQLHNIMLCVLLVLQHSNYVEATYHCRAANH